MSRRHQRSRIVWLVRILTAIGLIMVVTTTGLVGWTLAGMRRERTAVTAEEARLDRASHLLRESAIATQTEIYSTLDETVPASTNGFPAGSDFIRLIQAQRRSLAISAVARPLDALEEQATRLQDLAARASTWHAEYEPVWDDLREQRTMGRVRQILTQWRGAMETLEGRRRLASAIDHQRWRQAKGEDAARRARALLLETGRQESEGNTDFETQLAELARLVELLGGEEQFDNLNDLKDNKIKPVLDRLSRSIGGIEAHGTGSGALRPEGIEELKTALFGVGYRLENADQTVEVGRGGLFALRREALTLRRDREKLKSELAGIVQRIEATHATFMRSTQTRAAALTQQMEQSLAAGWNHLLLFGAGCAVLFFWLAWLITRGIDGQVDVIESARAEAETNRQQTQQLMLAQQSAAARLALAHDGLQASEQRFRMLSASAPIGIFETEATGCVLYSNLMWQTITGLSPAEALGEGWRRAVHPDDREKMFTEWEKVLTEAGSLDAEFRFCRHDGEVRWVHGRTAPVQAETGAVIGHVGTVEDITGRKHAEVNLEKMHRELLTTSRQAGMAEVATAVLHNVGNVLNSVNVAAICVAERLRKSKAASLSRVVAMLQKHQTDLGNFFTTDARARELPGFLAQLTDRLTTERTAALEELAHLQKNIEHIKDIVAMQQNYATVSGITETVQIVELIEDTLRMDADALARHDLAVVREFSAVPPVSLEKHKVLQIFVNLVRNAKQACDAAGGPGKTMTLRVFNGDGTVKVAVSDNGIGIEPENLTRIFNHGFTTKKEGHGFGLHSGALMAREMGGCLTAASDGLGTGATFTLVLPVSPPAKSRSAESDEKRPG